MHCQETQLLWLLIVLLEAAIAVRHLRHLVVRTLKGDMLHALRKAGSVKACEN